MSLSPSVRHSPLIQHKCGCFLQVEAFKQTVRTVLELKILLLMIQLHKHREVRRDPFQRGPWLLALHLRVVEYKCGKRDTSTETVYKNILM